VNSSAHRFFKDHKNIYLSFFCYEGADDEIRVNSKIIKNIPAWRFVPQEKLAVTAGSSNRQFVYSWFAEIPEFRKLCELKFKAMAL
jgi:hypothetical protein